ncbi:NADP-dependent oxidoreductase [Candidatus Roizmanbacteria bacterium]|nr:NADP-dependent oxidoreductase [Candidatus Roizmanbacteria bacterium]
MKAVQINNYGGYDVLEVKENVTQPRVGEGQVLVEVRGVSINPFDWKVRRGFYKENMPLQFPVTVGGDFAGVVAEVGKGVSDFNRGDEVYGSSNVFNGGSGSFAEFTTSNARNTALKPKNVNFVEAAALPLVGSSAVQALEEHIKLQKGQKILIHGGAGGIGHMAVQIAKAHGAFVATTVSADDKEFVKRLGTDQAIDYKSEKFEELLKDFDAVFDTVGGETTQRSFQVLRKGGTLVSMLGQPDKKLSEQYGATGIGQGTQTNAQHLSRLAELVDSGKVKVHIDKIFTLDEVREAFKHQEEGHPRGKVVLKIK